MELNKKHNIVHYSVIGIFVFLYIIVSVISTIHVIDFFALSNPYWLSVSLAIAFEIGAAASLASLIILDKMNKNLIWFLFILLTLVQMMGNTYFAYVNVINFQAWIELFGLNNLELILQKRILAIVSGALLPIVALGFIKSLVDYIRPDKQSDKNDELNKREDIIDKKIKEINDNNIEVLSKEYGLDKEEEITKNLTNELQSVIDDKIQQELEEKHIKIKELEEKEKDHIDTINNLKNSNFKDKNKYEEEKTKFEKELEDIKKELDNQKKKSNFEKELDKTAEELKKDIKQTVPKRKIINSTGDKIL